MTRASGSVLDPRLAGLAVRNVDTQTPQDACNDILILRGT